jgi:hypothetical protein
MGTTLTGTTPQDTYDSLIKVTDNGPLSGSLKKLTDGLGNDSSLSLSTTAASLSGTLAVTGNATFDTNTLFVDAANNQVGIGTSSPANPLSVGVTSVYNLPASTAQIGTADAGKFQLLLTSTSFNSDGNWVGLGMGYNENYLKTAIIARASDASARGTINFCLNSSATSANVSLADTRVTVTADGLTFNGDTAAANALDDYEEGTWTPVFAGTTTSGTYTYSFNSGGYRKIGSQVTVWGSLVDITESSAGTGDWKITSLPFTTSSDFVFARGVGSLYVRQAAATRTGLALLFSNGSTTLSPAYNNGSSDASSFTIAADYAAGMDIGFTLTYYV